MDDNVIIKREIVVRLTPQEIGEAFASLDSQEQAIALDTAWEAMLKWGESNAESQLIYIADDMNSSGKNMIELLASYL